jgi:hypothetical protein
VTVIEQLEAVVVAHPGLTVRDLVLVLKREGLDLTKSEVNHYLYLGHDLFRHEGNPPKWYLGPAVFNYEGRHRSVVNGADSKFVTVRQGPQFDVATEDLPGAPFFRVDQQGGRKTLCLNRSHQFYESYDSIVEETGRTVIQALLVAYGDSELDATGERAIWFQLVRDLWSHRYARALYTSANQSVASI